MSYKKSPLALIGQIRFQLDQLNARNAHHEFEHLCRHFARETITPNILPATGPVSSGGDQGRDFETFTTFIQNKPSDSHWFYGHGESKALVFACTLTKPKGLQKKIEGDIQTICEGTTPHLIYYFSNQDIPVAKRHALQAWCLGTFSCGLEILDAQTLSEQLAQPPRFWIAEQYLQIPSELLPLPVLAASGERYAQMREKWIVQEIQPFNYAHFVEVKYGLRKATFNDECKPDLGRWIRTIEHFLRDAALEDLRRRATYEVCVATLRGFHDLTPRRDLVERYFQTWGSSATDAVSLRDATVLLSYCSSAALTGKLEISLNQLHAWSKDLVGTLARLISKASGPHAIADLIYIRTYAAQLPFLAGSSPNIDIDEVFHWWFKLAAAAEKATLFPVEQLSDLMTVLTTFLGGDERFSKLTERIDKLLEKRSQGFLVAEKCRDRADAFLQAGKPLEAINELHRAKIRWFTGDRLQGSLAALIVLSDAYLKIGLVYAAKHHALAAAFVITAFGDDDLKELLPIALSQMAHCAYSAGEWVTYGEYFPIYFGAHYQYVADASDWQGNDFMRRSLSNFFVMQAFARTLAGQKAVDLIEAPLRTISMPEPLRKAVLETEVPMDEYTRMSAEEVMQKATDTLWGVPFSDCGQRRVYRWRALGITWNVECDNLLEQVRCVEEFVATLQIAIADLALSELCLLPTSMRLEIVASNVSEVELIELPSNELMSFKLAVPISLGSTAEDMQQVQTGVLGVAASLLTACSCLSTAEVRRRLVLASKEGLLTKAMMVRPYRELLAHFSDADAFDSRRGQSLLDADLSAKFELLEPADLAWREGPGPGYSSARAREALKNRYRRSVIPLSKTLPALRREPRFQTWVAERRAEGLLDWQILALILNAVFNARMSKSIQANDVAAHRAFISSEETDATLPYTLEDLLAADMEMVKRVSLAAVASTWKLDFRSRTPDFDALKRLLDARYGNSSDDVPHEDLFSPLT